VCGRAKAESRATAAITILNLNLPGSPRLDRIGLRPDLTKLPQMDRRQDEMENNDRIDVRENTIKDEQDVACERCDSKMPDRVHAKSRQDGGGSCKTKQV
jgi:hypothetical protein